jgi:hypothetical protein
VLHELRPLLEHQHHPTRREVDRLVLLHVILERELEAGLHVKQLADVLLGMGPPEFVAPGLLDALRLLELDHGEGSLA